MSDFDNNVPLSQMGGAALDAAVEKAFDKVGLSEKDFDLPPPSMAEPELTTEEDAPATEAKAPENEKDKQSRQRDPKGKFAADKEQGKAETQPSAKPLDAPAAPAHWSSQRKETFGKLPPEAQKAVLDFSKDSEATITRIANDGARNKTLADGVRSALTDEHREQLRRAGLDEVGGLRQLLKYQDMATKDPAGYVRMVMQNARLDPRQVFREFFTGAQPQAQPGQPSQAQPQALHPQIAQALQTLTGKIQSIEQRDSENQRRAAEAESQRMMRVVDDFTAEADAGGNLLRPHFEAVRQQVFEQLHAPSVRDIAEPRERLQRAYEIAVYGDPNLRDSIVTSEAQRIAKAAQQKADVDKARRARPLPLSGTSGNSSAPRPRTLDEAIDMTRRKFGS